MATLDQPLLQGHVASVTSCVFSPNSGWLATISKRPGKIDINFPPQFGPIIIWDTHAQTNFLVKPDGIQEVNSFGFSHDSEHFAFVIGDMVQIWSVRSRSKLPSPSSTHIYSIAWSPHDSILACGLEKGQIMMWSMNTFSYVNQLRLPFTNGSHSTHSRCKLTFSPDGRWLLWQQTRPRRNPPPAFLWEVASDSFSSTQRLPSGCRWMSWDPASQRLLGCREDGDG